MVSPTFPSPISECGSSLPLFLPLTRQRFFVRREKSSATCPPRRVAAPKSGDESPHSEIDSESDSEIDSESDVSKHFKS